MKWKGTDKKKKWMENKVQKNHNKTRGKKLNRHAQSDRINENNKKKSTSEKLRHFLNLPIEDLNFLKIARFSTRKIIPG